MREVLQRARVQYQAGKLRADAAVGGSRGNSRLHLHPRRHLQRSGHALRASGHHHRSALTTLACGDRISRSARRIAESKPVAGKIGGRSTCFDARPSSPELRLACTGAHSCGESLDSVYTGVPTRAGAATVSQVDRPSSRARKLVRMWRKIAACRAGLRSVQLAARRSGAGLERVQMASAGAQCECVSL